MFLIFPIALLLLIVICEVAIVAVGSIFILAGSIIYAVTRHIYDYVMYKKEKKRIVEANRKRIDNQYQYAKARVEGIQKSLDKKENVTYIEKIVPVDKESIEAVTYFLAPQKKVKIENIYEEVESLKQEIVIAKKEELEKKKQLLIYKDFQLQDEISSNNLYIQELANSPEKLYEHKMEMLEKEEKNLELTRERNAYGKIKI